MGPGCLNDDRLSYGDLDHCSSAAICDSKEFPGCNERHSISDSA